MADPNYTPTRVLLHDPDGVENPKSLYPVTGINCITVGTSGTDATTYVIDSGTTKINSAYLGIVSGTTVAPQYLPFEYVTGATNAIGGPVFANSDLNIFDGQGLIKSDLLPSYVDDVVEVPVIDNISSATGPLVILEGVTSGVTTYTFYEPSTSTGYIPGGGESGKIYVAATTGSGTVGDGSIYRCVTGSTTAAVKISENPYAISTEKTNGVRLYNDAGTLTAQADRASFNNYGTVQVSPDAVNNVKLQFVASSISGGAAVSLLSVSAGLVNGSIPGVVYAAATDADYSTLQSAYGDTSLVPTAKYMHDYVSAFVPAISVATSSSTGVVQIGDNIGVTASGIISVAVAGATTNGVVKIVDTINPAVEGNSSKAVTHGGIVTYVASTLNNYQGKLTPSNGIDITDNTIYAKLYGAAVFSGGAISVRDATANDAGVVKTVNTSAGVDDTDNAGAVPTASAISSYVNGKIAGMTIVSQGSGILITSSGGSKTIATRIDGAIVYSGGVMVARDATDSATGVVQLVTVSGDIDSAANSGYVPTAKAISGYVADKIQGITPIVQGSGINITESGGSKIIAIKNVDGGGLVFDTTGQVYVSSGTADSLGIVKVPAGSGLTISGGAITLDSATSETIGGVKVASTGAGITLSSGSIKANVTGALDISGNAIVIKDASVGSAGAVSVVASSAGIVAASGTVNAVPNAAGLIDYVSSGYQTKIAAGSGLVLVNGGTVDAKGTWPITVGADTIGINIAEANISNTVGPDVSATLGAVYVIGTVRSAFGSYTANTVPTESAVRAAINAIPYITYTPL